MLSPLSFASLGEFSFFTLVMGRVAGIFAATPMFGGKAVPMRVKAGLSLVMTMVLFPVIRTTLPELPTDSVSLILLVIRETMIGITLGLLSQAIFAAVEFCGQLLGIQIGFAMVNLFDPSMGGQLSIIAVFQTILATLLFMALGVHHFFIRSIVESYQLLPLGGWHMSGPLLQFITGTVTGMFVLGIKLAAPVMVSLMAATVVLGIMARIFPQMNVFIISMPLNIGVGFLILGTSLMVFMHTLEGAFGQLTRQIKVLFKVLS
ncbi:flagellar biosynthetic protein FliR [Geoanaerobacter pelophilus]